LTVPIARYAIAALLGLVLLVGAMLLVRPLIFSLAPERGDGNYAVAASDELGPEPFERELLLSQSHGLLGERANGRRVILRVIVSQPPTGGVAVVNAWSPDARCAVMLAGDRLRDCRGATWTFEGIPISADRPLQRFATTVRSGAVIVDFTRPIDGT
jgi:hypothetical protein